uniref:Uncharacterized protein n=1 Tax=Desertifilum tharense IPPAS B-1220 TaxID=1781255 RepID=A0ACD5GT49_9CYAN
MERHPPLERRIFSSSWASEEGEGKEGNWELGVRSWGKKRIGDE